MLLDENGRECYRMSRKKYINLVFPLKIRKWKKNSGILFVKKMVLFDMYQQKLLV